MGSRWLWVNSDPGPDLKPGITRTDASFEFLTPNRGTPAHNAGNLKKFCNLHNTSRSSNIVDYSRVHFETISLESPLWFIFHWELRREWRMWFLWTNLHLAVKSANQKKNNQTRKMLLLHNTELYAQGHSRNKAGEPDFQMLSKPVQVYSDEWMILSPVCSANKEGTE